MGTRAAKRAEGRDIDAEIREGLAEAERGETADLGSFAGDFPSGEG